MSYMRFKDKVVIVTGSGRGLGRETAILFAEEGAQVAVIDISAQRGEETVDIIKKNKGNAFFVQTDVSQSADVQRMVRRVLERDGRVDVLVNNAGIANAAEDTWNCSEELWDRLQGINLKGTFLCSKYVLPHMIKQSSGSIVNVGSTAAIQGRAIAVSYCASKGGVVALTRALAVSPDLCKNKIRVNCVCPGAMDAGQLWTVLESYPQKERERVRQLFKSKIPLGRIANSREVAAAILFLASADASFITGAVLLADGGTTAGFASWWQEEERSD